MRSWLFDSQLDFADTSMSKYEVECYGVLLTELFLDSNNDYSWAVGEMLVCFLNVIGICQNGALNNITHFFSIFDLS